MGNSFSRTLSILNLTLRPSTPETTPQASEPDQVEESKHTEVETAMGERQGAGSVGKWRDNVLELDESDDEEVRIKVEDDDSELEIMEPDEYKRRKGIREGKKRAVDDDDEDFARNQCAPSPAVTSKPTTSNFNSQLPTPHRDRNSSISSTTGSIVPESSPPSPSASTPARYITPEFPFPSPPASPAPLPARTSFPLENLTPVGSIILENVKLYAGYDGAAAEDGWIPFSRDLLVPIGIISLDDTSDSEESDAPSLSSSRLGKKRGRASQGRSAVSKKKAKVVDDKLLDKLITCSETSTLRATVKLIGFHAVIRIYLIPEDLPERIQLAETKNGKVDRPRVLLAVLSSVRRNQYEWNGQMQKGAVTMFMEESDTRSLLEIFQQVERPCQDGFDKLEASEEIKARLEKAVTGQSDKVKTKLYLYQQASVTKMLARELAPQHVVSPFFLPRTSLTDPSKQVYVSLQNGQVVSSPPRLLEPKGGILAENMGDGKSLIVLALVVSTLGELPSLDGTSIYKDGTPSDRSPVLLTQQSIDFPFATEQEDRRRTRARRIQAVSNVPMTPKEEEENERGLAAQAQLDLEDSQHHPPLPSLRNLMINHLRTTRNLSRRDEEIIRRHNETHSKQLDLEAIRSSSPFYRTFAPPQQLRSRQGAQWATDQFNPKSVASYATAAEKRRAALASPFSIIEIHVTSATLVVVPDVLIKQWLKDIGTHLEADSFEYLVLETGDMIPSAEQFAKYDLVLMSSTRFSRIASAAKSSRGGSGREDLKKFKLVHWKRLVVDEGHVLGTEGISDTKTLAEKIRCESRWAISGTPTTNLRGDTNDTTPPSTASLFGGDGSDYSGLGRLYSLYLRHPAFPFPKSFTQLVTSLIERPSRIAGVLNSSVVRHRSEVIKQYRTLPELTIKPVFVRMEEAERKMYNLLAANFSTNAIQTNRGVREGGYFFDKKERNHLQELTMNLATSTTFFASSHTRPEAKIAIKSNNSLLKQDGLSDEDREGIKSAIEILTTAGQDSTWRLVTDQISVCVEVTGIDESIIETFGGVIEPRSLLCTKQLVRLRRIIEELQHEDVKEWEVDEELSEEMISFEAKAARGEKSLFKQRSKTNDVLLHPLPDDSFLRKIQLVRTSSAKINHVLDEFQKYPDEKFIIFSSSRVDLVFATLSEVLDVFRVPHVILTGKYKGSGTDGGSKVQHFNSTSVQECKAILVDAEKGGRGVHLTAASRIIMLEPIWKPDLEVQATKRAHRLGQTKPVDVQILIVKNTYEHNLFERRQKIAPKEFTTSAKLPQEDSALKEVLQSAQYLPRREEGSADPAPLAGSPHFLFPRVNDDNGDAMMVD